MCGICISHTLPIKPIELNENSYNDDVISNTQVIFLDLTIPHTCPECGYSFLPVKTTEIKEHQTSPRLLCGGW